MVYLRGNGALHISKGKGNRLVENAGSSAPNTCPSGCTEANESGCAGVWKDPLAVDRVLDVVFWHCGKFHKIKLRSSVPFGDFNSPDRFIGTKERLVRYVRNRTSLKYSHSILLINSSWISDTSVAHISQQYERRPRYAVHAILAEIRHLYILPYRKTQILVKLRIIGLESEQSFGRWIMTRPISSLHKQLEKRGVSSSSARHLACLQRRLVPEKLFWGNYLYKK